MAETLGSLIDKLSIKNLRSWHLEEMIAGKNGTKTEVEVEELKAKLETVEWQRQDLQQELDAFFDGALEGKVKIRDEKVKLYDNPAAVSAEGMDDLGNAISELALRNIKLWHLEDEVRRTDIPHAEVVRLKREIDTANQERNNFIDKIDEILWVQANKRK